MKLPITDLRQELRDLARALDGGVGKPPFDYEGYQRVHDALWASLTDEQRAHWTATMEGPDYGRFR